MCVSCQTRVRHVPSGTYLTTGCRSVTSRKGKIRLALRTRVPGPLPHDNDTLEPLLRLSLCDLGDEHLIPRKKPLCPGDTVAHGPLCYRSRTAARCGPVSRRSLVKDTLERNSTQTKHVKLKTAATGHALCPRGEPPLDDSPSSVVAGTSGDCELFNGQGPRDNGWCTAKTCSQTTSAMAIPLDRKAARWASNLQGPCPGFRRLRINEGVHLYVGSRSDRKCDVKGTSRQESGEESTKTNAT